MPKLKPIEELDAAIRLAAKDAEPTVPSFQVAESFYELHRELIQNTVLDQWVIEKLALLIGKHRAKVRRENNPQLMLEGTLGFHRLPTKIEVSPGERIARTDVTLVGFRRLLAKLGKRKTPRQAEVERAIELMEKYTKRGGAAITWGEVVKREAEKARTKNQ